jgi:hypothetical protein
MTYSFTLKFGKYKGQNFNSTPISYQKWLLVQNWFKIPTQSLESISKSVIVDKYTLQDFQSLIGKYIKASGWHYDNSGNMSGTIISIEPYSVDSLGKTNYTIIVMASKNSTQNEMTFNYRHLVELLEKGKLPEANILLNTGTDAEIIF